MPTTHFPAACPRCEAGLRVRREFLGQWVSCRYCGQVFEATEHPSQVETPTPRRPFEAARDPFPRQSPFGTAGHHAQAEEALPADPLASLRAERDAALEALEGARAEAARARARLEEEEARCRSGAAALEALRGDYQARLVEVETLRRDGAEEASRLNAELAKLRSSLTPPRLPVLCRDLERWSISIRMETRAAVHVAVAVPVGPPPLPPSLDDLSTVDDLIAVLRALLATPSQRDQSFHTLFDAERFLALKAKLREAALLSDRLTTQVERSRTQKDLLWHLMLARRSDEVHRKRR